MPTIQEMGYGFDSEGINTYLEALKAIVLTKAAERIRDISTIERVCNENWEGDSKERYLEHLRKSANHTAEQFENLYKILLTEITAIQNSMGVFDKNLFNGVQ